jgi:hypothetical protein
MGAVRAELSEVIRVPSFVMLLEPPTERRTKNEELAIQASSLMFFLVHS